MTSANAATGRAAAITAACVAAGWPERAPTLIHTNLPLATIRRMLAEDARNPVAVPPPPPPAPAAVKPKSLLSLLQKAVAARFAAQAARPAPAK